MVSVEEHYDALLANVYTWLMGGFEQAKENNIQFFNDRMLSPAQSGNAVDLGAGSGFQTIPLAEAGYHVTAIDLSDKLLDELQGRAGNLPVNTVQDNILNLHNHIKTPVELIVCMTDTLTHLRSREEVQDLFSKSFNALETGGKLVLTFRDLSEVLIDTDRFIPVRSDENIIFTCFLEYETDTVKVHDIVYIRTGNEWTLHKSCYRKLRISGLWVKNQLSQTGFAIQEFSCQQGFTTVVAEKPAV
ncbi:class I SAM-dependent methyltransferase [Endozoicomonadaceae bacterium StTr2]